MQSTAQGGARLMRFRITLIIGLSILILIPFSALSHETVPGEIVVRLKSAAAAKSANPWSEVTRRLARALRQKTVAQAKVFATDETFAVVRISESKKSQAISALKADEAVAYAEPNFIYRAFETREERPSRVNAAPNDEFYSRLWGLSNTGQTDAAGQAGRPGADIGVEPIWARGIIGSKQIKVAVIDTGIAYDHPDLVDNIWTNPGEIAGNRIDDDQNGFVDDVHGWSFAPQGPENTTSEGDPRDDHYHGTHCAGTIGASGNNGIGIAGVSWQVTLVPIKFLDHKGSGSLAGAVQSIQYATRVGVQIMSNSWGGGAYSQSLYDVIAEARDKGIVFVASAGNNASDNDESPSYPATYAIDNIISVAASDNMDRVARFSNYGRRTVHVAAPGVKILSTAPANEGGYKTLSGTSMAAPHVSGIVALLLAQDPTRTYSQIKNTLIETSDRKHALTRKSVSGGRVNVENAFNNMVPSAPVGPSEDAWVDVKASIESVHPYAENSAIRYPISIPGAKYIRVVFEKAGVEKNFDFIRVLQANGDEIEAVTGEKSNYTTDYLEGDSATLVLESDETVNQYGFKVAKLQAVF